MSEKTEFKLKLIINFLLVFLFGLGIILVLEQSKYTEKEHQIEQGNAAVYLSEPTSGDVAANDGKVAEEKRITKAEYTKSLDLNSYEIMDYEAILKECTDKSGKKVLLKVTVYSSLKTGSAIVYKAADSLGNYYSISDDTGMFDKYEKADVIQVYAVSDNSSKLNGSEIPALKLDYIIKK